MLDCKPVKVSLAVYFKLCKLCCPKTEEEKLEMSQVLYANVVGSLCTL